MLAVRSRFSRVQKRQREALAQALLTLSFHQLPKSSGNRAKRLLASLITSRHLVILNKSRRQRGANRVNGFCSIFVLWVFLDNFAEVLVLLNEMMVKRSTLPFRPRMRRTHRTVNFCHMIFFALVHNGTQPATVSYTFEGVNYDHALIWRRASRIFRLSFRYFIVNRPTESLRVPDLVKKQKFIQNLSRRTLTRSFHLFI